MSDTQHTAEEQLPADKCLSVKCPHCEQSFPVALAAYVPDEQRMSIEIGHKSPFISARTLGETMSNMNDLLIAVAKDIGSKVAVMVESCELSNGKATINFIISRVEDQTQDAPVCGSHGGGLATSS